MVPNQFPCKQCGANLQFAPGLDALKCPYCGAENPVPKVEVEIEELDFHQQLNLLRSNEETYEVIVVKCPNCAAETTFDPNITTDSCAFCGVALVSHESSNRLIKPKALLPFKITKQEGNELFRKWLDSLWFAPNDLKAYARREGKLAGMYIPHWTFDSDTTTPWRGQRGEHYYETETYTTTENGKSVTRTRQVRKTRWYPASGTLKHFFDDTLVVASESLPRKYMTALEPWDLDDIVPYSDEYLSGFRTESYTVDLETSWSLAAARMDQEIDRMIRREIGGDEQRITSKSTRHADITFKHILLPVWLSAYRYREKTYRFIVNARTGAVQGERPWSWIKITLAVIAALLVLAVVLYFTQGQ